MKVNNIEKMKAITYKLRSLFYYMFEEKELSLAEMYLLRNCGQRRKTIFKAG